MIKMDRLRASCNENLTVIKKLKFAFGGREQKLEGLINRLREYNEVLWRYAPGVEVTRLDKGIYDEIAKIMGDQLKLFFDVYTKEAESTSNPMVARRYKEMAKLANFRSQLRQNQRITRSLIFKPHQFYITDNYAVDSCGMSTMGILNGYPLLSDRRVVLIEWIQNPRLPGRREDVEKLARLLSTPTPEEMLVLKCYGLYNDHKHGRLGIVLKPPRNIRMDLPAILAMGAISVRRKPITLRALMMDTWASSEDVDLGTRFSIAKKLVDTVHMIHASEWVHK